MAFVCSVKRKATLYSVAKRNNHKLVDPLTEELIASIEKEQEILRNKQFAMINEVMQFVRVSNKRSTPVSHSQSEFTRDCIKKNRPLNTYEATKDIQEMLDDTVNDASDYSASVGGVSVDKVD